MTTPVKGGDWSSATLYESGRPVEPRMFTEADPMGTMLVGDWRDGAPESAPGDLPGEPQAQWGATTLVGRPARGASGAPAAASATAGARAETSAASAESGALAAASATAGARAETSAASAASTPDTSNTRLLAASGSMAVASLISRLTGFVRSVLLVVALGAGAVGNAYNSGNNLPNMIYELLLGGVLSSVLIPLLVHAQVEDDDDGDAYTQRLLSIAAAALAGMTLLAVLAAPLIAAAFVPSGPQRQLTSIFATLLLPEIFFYGLGAMFMAVLNIKHSYAAGAWSPVLNNVIMIGTILVFFAMPGPATLNPSTITTAQILVLGIGTTLGIAAQALVLVPALRRAGFRWQWRFRARPSEVGRMKDVGTLAGWVLAYVVISQVGVTVIQKVGNANGGFTVFTNADLLFQMPYGILVVSLLTAIMPRLSRAAVRGDTAAVVEDLSLGARLSAVALVPVTAILIALAPSMAVALFAYGNTSIAYAHLIGSSLAWSAFGLFPFALVMLQLRVFYAMRDGKTPALINLFMVGTKVVLILVTNELYRVPDGVDVNLHPSRRAVEWLNISTSMSYVVGAVVGHVVLTRRLGTLSFGPVVRTVVQMAIASATGAVVAYGAVFLSHEVLGAARLGSFVALVGGGIVGLAVLASVSWRMRIPELRRVVAMLRRTPSGGNPAVPTMVHRADDARTRKEDL